jgi:tripartite-type tricarboxylate transporter receptor subunit TctC
VAIAWTGIGAPKNTPTEVIDELNRENNAALADSNMRLRLADLGTVPMPMSPGDFGKFIAEEAEKWAKAVKFSGAKPDWSSGVAAAFHSSRYANRKHSD